MLFNKREVNFSPSQLPLEALFWSNHSSSILEKGVVSNIQMKLLFLETHMKIHFAKHFPTPYLFIKKPYLYVVQKQFTKLLFHYSISSQVLIDTVLNLCIALQTNDVFTNIVVNRWKENTPQLDHPLLGTCDLINNKFYRVII